MGKCIYDNVLRQIEEKEQKLSLHIISIEESREMIVYLQNMLNSLKQQVVKNGFKNEEEEIKFFKITKPKILGKLIYYNKMYIIEIGCPVKKGKLYTKYYSSQLQSLKQEYQKDICNSDFYRYYRSSRNDWDGTYFQRGNINYHDGHSSIVFEIDPEFSTFYDYKVARIISGELLYSYLLSKINPDESPDTILQNQNHTKEIFWTDSKNALIELVYALYASKVISHGNISLRKISLVFQILFRVSLNDVHNSFHRMKTRSGSRTLFLDNLKANLEEYMDKDENF